MKRRFKSYNWSYPIELPRYFDARFRPNLEHRMRRQLHIDKIVFDRSGIAWKEWAQSANENRFELVAFRGPERLTVFHLIAATTVNFRS